MANMVFVSKKSRKSDDTTATVTHTKIVEINMYLMGTWLDLGTACLMARQISKAIQTCGIDLFN